MCTESSSSCAKPSAVCMSSQAFTTDFRVHWAQHPLRPEFAESTYFLYKVRAFALVPQDPVWRGAVVGLSGFLLNVPVVGSAVGLHSSPRVIGTFKC